MKRPFTGKDIKYKAIFDNASIDHDESLQAVIDAVRNDELRDLKTMMRGYVTELNSKDTEIQKLKNELNAQGWISMGENVGAVRGSSYAVKAVRQLIIDGEQYRKQIMMLEFNIIENEAKHNAYVEKLNSLPPKRILSEDSRTLTTVVNAVKRFFLFGGK